MKSFAEVPNDVSADQGRVLAKAVVNASKRLGLSQRELGQVLGVSEAMVSRMKGGGASLGGKSLQLAACVVRVFRSLDAIAGGDADTIRGWMGSPNTDLNGVPKELVASVAGLVDVMNYLDAARAPT